MSNVRKSIRPPKGFHWVATNRPAAHHGAKAGTWRVHLRSDKAGNYYAACGVYGVHRVYDLSNARRCNRCEAAAFVRPEGP